MHSKRDTPTAYRADQKQFTSKMFALSTVFTTSAYQSTVQGAHAMHFAIGNSEQTI